MKYLSVCSGIEAATVAWHPLGWTPAAYCEIEAFPSAVLAHHYPTVPNYGDFTRLIDAAHPIRDAGVDLLVGGTPCQAFSVAGLRRGLADARGGLTLEFVRLAQALRPRWIVWENVPGVLSQDGGRAFGAFLGALGELGYGWAYRVLDAQWFGVAQRRRRVFVVACAGGRSERAAAVLFEPEGVRRDPPTRGEAGQGAAADARGDAAAGVPDVVGTLSDGAHNGGGLNGQDAYTGRILPVAFDTTQITSPLNRSVPKSGDPCHPLAAGAHPPAVAFDARQNDVLLYGDKTGPLDTDGHALRAEGADAGEDGTGRGTPIVPITFGFDAGQSENPKATHQFSVECAPPLIKARPMSIAGAQMAVRRLTPRECERLQGFPDDYTRISWKKKPADECPDGPRYKALGNSMAVPVMRWIGERIAKVEKV
jgi:DNA (cytosine-5)-methyltransferase 1